MRRNVQKHIATAVRILRKLRGLSRAELAARSHLDEGYLRDVERGKRDVSFGALGLLAKGLDCDAADLLGRSADDLLRDLVVRMHENLPMTPAPHAVRWAPFERGPPPDRPEPRCAVLRDLASLQDDEPMTPAPHAQRCPSWDPPKRRR
jgi:transcriptional regulator with XRE-family HTH domain